MGKEVLVGKTKGREVKTMGREISYRNTM